MRPIEAPVRIPLILRVILFLVERRLGKKLVANRILSWYPKLFIGSGVMESLVAHDDDEVPRRLLGLIRLYTSFLVSCPFCIDMNARELLEKGITEQEIRGLQGRGALEDVPSLTEGERVALRYVRSMCSTPLSFAASMMDDLQSMFSPRAIVIMAGTCAQVNFWARLIQALGVPPAGFSSQWPVLNLDDFATHK